jgi:hypothetical protein
MSGVDLDVTERQLTLITPNNQYYLQIGMFCPALLWRAVPRLMPHALRCALCRVALPYAVEKDKSSAKFIKSKCQLDVTLAITPL